MRKTTLLSDIPNKNIHQTWFMTDEIIFSILLESNIMLYICVQNHGIFHNLLQSLEECVPESIRYFIFHELNISETLRYN